MSVNDLPGGNTHYVDNKRFHKLLVERAQQIKEAGSPIRVSDELGLIFLKISENLSYRRNFINYSFRDEMVGDGVEDCIRRVDNYDCEKYSNPFAYFTQTCFFAFVRRIKLEGKQPRAINALREAKMVDSEYVDNYEFQNSVVDELFHENG